MRSPGDSMHVLKLLFNRVPEFRSRHTTFQLRSPQCDCLLVILFTILREGKSAIKSFSFSTFAAVLGPPSICFVEKKESLNYGKITQVKYIKHLKRRMVPDLYHNKLHPFC